MSLAIVADFRANLPLNFPVINSHVVHGPVISYTIEERLTTSVSKTLINAELDYSTINKKYSNEILD